MSKQLTKGQVELDDVSRERLTNLAIRAWAAEHETDYFQDDDAGHEEWKRDFDANMRVIIRPCEPGVMFSKNEVLVCQDDYRGLERYLYRRDDDGSFTLGSSRPVLLRTEFSDGNEAWEDTDEIIDDE